MNGALACLGQRAVVRPRLGRPGRGLGRRPALVLLVCLAVGCGRADRPPGQGPPPELLSAYHLFRGDPRLQNPAAGVIP